MGSHEGSASNTVNLDQPQTPPGEAFHRRHNEIRDMTATLMSEVCHNVKIELGLQPVTGEQFEHSLCSNCCVQSRLAVGQPIARMVLVWTLSHKAFGEEIDRVHFLMLGYLTHTHLAIATPPRPNAIELEKKRCYEERFREIEHGSFTPLVLSAAGGIGPVATIVYKRLASLISEKQGRQYSSTLHWVRCRLNFSLLRSAVMCIRGSRSTFASEVSTDSIDLAVHEGQVQSF